MVLWLLHSESGTLVLATIERPLQFPSSAGFLSMASVTSVQLRSSPPRQILQLKWTPENPG